MVLQQAEGIRLHDARQVIRKSGQEKFVVSLVGEEDVFVAVGPVEDMVEHFGLHGRVVVLHSGCVF